MPAAASAQSAPAAQKAQAQSPQGQCAALPLEQFRTGAQRAKLSSQIESKVGGKAIGPDAFNELDAKVKNLRQAENDWVALVVNIVKPLPDQKAKLEAAIKAAEKNYQTYIALAREVARMLKALYGAEETKFKGEPIVDDLLMPELP